MKLNKIKIWIFQLLLLYSCNINDTVDVNNLKNENLVLKSENDSLRRILNYESLSPVVFASNYNGYETNEDKLEFILVLSYMREGLIQKVSYNVFSDSDSIDIALYENKNLLKHTIRGEEFDGVLVYEAKDYEKGENFFVGIISVISIDNKIKDIPFKYKFTEVSR